MVPVVVEDDFRWWEREMCENGVMTRNGERTKILTTRTNAERERDNATPFLLSLSHTDTDKARLVCRIHTSCLYIHTLVRDLASCTPRQQEVVVLPTPPFPPTKIHCRDSWSARFLSDGSGRSSPSVSAMVSVCILKNNSDCYDARERECVCVYKTNETICTLGLVSMAVFVAPTRRLVVCLFVGCWHATTKAAATITSTRGMFVSSRLVSFRLASLWMRNAISVCLSICLSGGGGKRGLNERWIDVHV